MVNYLSKFKELFGNAGEIRTYFAPGRVNLIGEHTDYNGGHVLPCALTLGTYAAVRKRTDNKLRLYSMNFDECGIIESDLNSLTYDKNEKWANYPKGVMWAFKTKGYEMSCGLDMVIYGNIPNGSGLSSSASLEVLTGVVLKDLFQFPVTMIDVALTGQYAENNFNGCNCGIMDQFASAMGKKNHAIFLDTNTLKYKYVPVEMDGAKVVIVNSKVKHSLVDSAYNDRRNECEKALKELQEVTDIQSLGELSKGAFTLLEGNIKSSVRKRRAKHAVYENQRTVQAVTALTENKIDEFGKLMNESHVSLRDDYEVSCAEIDFLVEEAWKNEGIIGARITGGGFGGCTVNIVKDEYIEAFKNQIEQKYEEKFGIKPDIYVVEIGDGAGRLS